MTKNSSDQWSESFLNKHEIFPFQKSLVVFIKAFYSKISITQQPYKGNV